MKGALEELDEPVDDLMEVSKVQTQILNLTRNQVNVFDEATQEFRSTYDIMKDISEIWDTLSSTNRANLTEILFGKNRANYGLALIQAFQTGQVESAFIKATDAAGTATKEYQKMMEGIQSQADALKGSLEEFANAFMKSEFVKNAATILKGFVNLLTLLTEKVGSLGIALAPIAAYISAKSKMGIFSAIISGIKGITASTVELTGAATGASVAFTGLKTVLTSLASAGIAIFIGAAISALSTVVDKLIITRKEAEETIDSITGSTVDLGEAIDELESDQAKLESIAQNYSKVATTVENVTERKQQLYEIQTELVDNYGKEADGIDLVNGKYSEQIKKLNEIADKEREKFKIENAADIAQTKRLANLNVEAPRAYNSEGAVYHRENDREGELALYTLEDLDSKAIEVGKNIEGVYKTLEGIFDAQGLYLTGTIYEARDQLGAIIEAYSRVEDIDEKTFEYLKDRYTRFNTEIENIEKFSEYMGDSAATTITGLFQNVYSALEDSIKDVTFQPFYDKLDEAQEKLQKLATGNLGIDEYTSLTTETRALQEELYKLADGNEWATKKVTDLFQAYQQGLSESGDGLQDFLERFESQLEGSFKDTAEIITSVQNGIEKLSEGKGLSNSEAWKLLKADSEGYLKTIRLVNGEYVFAEEELIKFKDAEIQKTVETIKADNAKAQAAVNNLKAQNADREQTLYLMRQEIEANAILMGQQQAAKKYAEDTKKIRIQVSETKTTIENYEKAIARNNLLIEELTQNLGYAQNAADATLQSLNNTVDALEAEVDAIEDAVDALNERKDALESEKDILQEQLELLKEQKEELKSQMDTFKKAVSDYSKRYEDSLKTELDRLKDQKDEIKDQYDERIKALKRENEERDTAYKKEKAILDLNKAKEQQVRTYSSARGWEYGASKEKVLEAQKNLEDILLEEQIQNLENERDDAVKAYEDQEKEQEKHLKAFQEYAKQYEDAAEIIENADGEILAEQILGANWRVEMENQDERLLNRYKNAYQDFTTRLDDLTNRQIKAAEESVKAKQAEIDKINDDIKAYNNYKTTVKNNLEEAKKAVENYKNEVTGYNENIINSVNDMAKNMGEKCNDAADSFFHLQDEIWKNSGKICTWIADVINAFNELKDSVGSGAVGALGMGLSHILGSHANGGVADYTGLAMLHGSKSKPETIFNAADSKKLYDLVHGTPNLVATMAQQSIQALSKMPTTNNTSSINVNIGQVVANNPREFTQNLDTHLDSYFRRKLTQGYAQ